MSEVSLLIQVQGSTFKVQSLEQKRDFFSNGLVYEHRPMTKEILWRKKSTGRVLES
jgi:hypothetical protein